MDVRAAHPSTRLEGDALWLSYRTAREDHFAVVRFSGVKEYQLGAPSDEHLETHPLRDSELLKSGLRRWVVAFHDETLEVTARGAEVVIRAIQARDAESALAMVHC